MYAEVSLSAGGGVEVHCLSIERPFPIRRLPIPPRTGTPETRSDLSMKNRKKALSIFPFFRCSLRRSTQRDFHSSKERKEGRKGERKEEKEEKGKNGNAVLASISRPVVS